MSQTRRLAAILAADVRRSASGELASTATLMRKARKPPSSAVAVRLSNGRFTA